ncbi:CLUMA_CG020142, isoform A [Clunio marinus]|uniref:CLUMA_CG020142, isoform A n=1 Tax=Clunio marinus TaxID=568069 RepID=A0A1J1J3Z5_9DIPT|nr:CLUMA_CG020142, isoform A [Clunio marinus]
MDVKNMLLFAFLLHFVAIISAQKYYGTHISRLSELHHGVSGDVYAVDSRTLFIKDFTYDGEGPAAYFYVGTSRAPSAQGAIRIRDERGSNEVLRPYRHKDITLTLPEGKTLRDIKWFSVWCDEFSVDFGSVVIPKNLDFPRPRKIGGLRGIHAVSSDSIVIVDAQTLLIPNFNYDGVAPDAKFWVGRGEKPTPNGIRISDENGKESPLRRYDRKTIVLTLPGDLSVFDIGHFGVWCEAFTVDFGHVRIPEKVNVPPSLKMLGISPQSKLNCEVLHDELAFEVRWAVAGESVVIQLVAKLDDNEYMSFGVSSDTENSLMVRGDVVVSWVNRLTGKGYAQDYFLESKSQCSGNHGSCPDTRLKDNANSIRLLNAAIVNDYSIVTYQRPLRAADQFDSPIYTNGSQAIIWAIGPLNQRFEVSYHTHFLKKNKFLDFGRQPFWNCPIPENDGKPILPHHEDIKENNRSPPQKLQQNKPPTPKPVPKVDAWDIPPIQCYEPEDGVFYAQMGPTGGRRGYPAITGHVGWGISWYINGLLIPEINVVRGKTYTFIVEGGNEVDIAAKYHPFYITDDPVGGYEHKTEDEKKKVKVFSGVQQSRNGKVIPTGVGRICNWTPDIKGPPADDYPSFGAYQRSLTLKCDSGEPGIITWTPDQNTPDTVYYQCFTHRYLGWKINVLDSCDIQPQASDRHETYDDIAAEPSIKHETKLNPSDNFLTHDVRNSIKKQILNPIPSKVTEELKKSGELEKLINEGILAAETFEEKLLKEQSQNLTHINSSISQSNHEILENKKTLEMTSKIPIMNHTQNLRFPLPKRIYSSNGFPVFLKPQQNINIIANRPVRLPSGRPISIKQRPHIHNRKPITPYLTPQQSIMVNHYRKPSYDFNQQPLIRNNHVRNKVPALPKVPVLLLGEPTEINSYRKVPATDLEKNFYGTPETLSMSVHKLKKNQQQSKKNVKHSTTRSPFKDPFNIKAEIQPVHEVPNTGFKADSVIVESGFRPILNRQDVVRLEESSEENGRNVRSKISISRRIDDFVSEDEDLVDAPKSVYFEPIFIPSPRDSVAAPFTNSSDEQTDHMTADASERQDIFYLPPSETKRSAAIYDAKAILDTSLLNDPLPSKNDFVKLSSKTKQFIKDTPQFLPFTGEIPSDLMKQLSTNKNKPVSTHVISTKLSAVTNNNRR